MVFQKFHLTHKNVNVISASKDRRILLIDKEFVIGWLHNINVKMLFYQIKILQQLCTCTLRIGDRSMTTQYSTTNPKLGNKKSWGERRASWCMCGMLGCDQSMKTQNLTTNPKLGNKPKSRKKKSWGERQASWCVWGMLGCDQSMKTQNSTTNPKLGNTKLWGERRAS